MRTNNVAPVFFVIFIQLLSILILLPSHMTRDTIIEESSVLSKWYGETVAEWTITTANEQYKTLFINTGIAEWGIHRFESQPMHSNSLSRRVNGILSPIMNWMGDRFVTILNMAYLVIMRGLEMILWLPWVICILVHALIDGAMGRKIGQTDYAYTSPVRQRTAIIALKVAIVGTPVLFFMPLPLNPLVVPMALFCSAVSMGMVLRNLHKRV